MKVDRDPGLLPMVGPAFSAPLPPVALAGVTPHYAPLTEVQQLQQKFRNLTELLTNLLGNVEKMNTCVGELERKGQGALPQVGKNKDEMEALGARLRELARVRVRDLFKDTLPEFVPANLNLRITEVQQYLMFHGFWQTMVPPPSAPPPAQSSHFASAPSVSLHGPPEEPPCALVSPVPAHQASARLQDVALGQLFVPLTPYNAPIDSSTSPTAPSSPKVLIPGPSFFHSDGLTQAQSPPHHVRSTPRRRLPSALLAR